jgi:hypothetical protein
MKKIRSHTEKEIEQAKKLMQEYGKDKLLSISQWQEYLKSKNKRFVFTKKTILAWYKNMDIQKRKPSKRKQCQVIGQTKKKTTEDNNAIVDAYLSTGYLEFLVEFSRDIPKYLRQLNDSKLSNEEKLGLQKYILQWKHRADKIEEQLEIRIKNPMPNSNIDRSILIKTSVKQGRKKYTYKIDLTGKTKLSKKDQKIANAMKKAWFKRESQRERDTDNNILNFNRALKQRKKGWL